MLKQSVTYILMLSALLLTPLAHSKSDLSTERKQFLQAEKALLAGNNNTYQKLRTNLNNYSLTPYLDYLDLKQRMGELPIKSMQTFFSNNADLPVAAKLREEWLFKLAKKEEWIYFIQFYQPTQNAKLQCLYAKAKLNVGDVETAKSVIERLWLVGYSQPKECDDVFNTWKAKNLYTNELKTSSHSFG